MTLKNDATRSFLADREWLRRALRVIPQASQTSSKAVDRIIDGSQPHFAVHACGGCFTDPDGNEWIDLQMGLGTVLLGFGDPFVKAAVIEQLERGPLFSVASTLEATVAEKILLVLPEFERIRFAKNGSDVTSAAVRLSRHITGRDEVITCGYHGWHDWSMTTHPEVGGIPLCIRALTQACTHGEVQHILRLIEGAPRRYAAVIIDCKHLHAAEHDVVNRLRSACTENGVLLIFDELVSGFRFGPRGFAGTIKLFPDLACYGKAVANGFALAVLAGKAEFMDRVEDIGFTTTFGGDCIGLAAARATLEQLGHTVCEHTQRLGQFLATSLNLLIERCGLGGLVACVGHPSVSELSICHGEDAENRTARRLIADVLAKHGVFWQGNHVLCRDHTEGQIDRVLVGYSEALSHLAKRWDRQ